MEKEKFIKIRKYINDCKAKMVELETLLTSHPALAPENGGEGELEKAKALVDWLKKEGFAENQIQEIDAPDSRVKSGVRPNVIVTIPGESDDFEQSRMNGQLLALNIATPHIINESYDLVADIHASNGGYVQDPYIFAPVDNDTVAKQSADNLTKVLTNLIYYEPASYSSPQYSTIPIDDGGVPAIVFEMRGNPDHSLTTEADQFIHVVDKLNL